MNYTLEEGRQQLWNYLVTNKIISPLTPKTSITFKEEKIVHNPTYNCQFTITLKKRKPRHILATLDMNTREKILMIKIKPDPKGKKKILEE